jgi:hypothetical protein
MTETTAERLERIRTAGIKYINHERFDWLCDTLQGFLDEREKLRLQIIWIGAGLTQAEAILAQPANHSPGAGKKVDETTAERLERLERIRKDLVPDDDGYAMDPDPADITWLCGTVRALLDEREAIHQAVLRLQARVAELHAAIKADHGQSDRPEMTNSLDSHQNADKNGGMA